MNKNECPLCGKNNLCALTIAEGSIDDCWCKITPVPKKILDKIPAKERNQRCICPNCAQQIDILAKEINP
jgi:Cysteine-rich CWC